MRRLLVTGSFLVGLVHVAVAFAQGADPANIDPPPSSTPAGQAPPAEASRAEPNLPEIDDPMLVPAPAPPHLLSNWRQGVELVKRRSTSLAIAHARILQANALARQALSASLPSLNANGRVSRNLLFGYGVGFTAEGIQLNARVPIQATNYSAGVSLRQPLIDLKTWYDMETAEVGEQVAEAQEEDAERQALGALADTLVSVVTADRLAEVSRVSLRSNLSTLDLTRRRTRLGAASAVDVLRAEQEVASNRADVVQVDEALRRAQEALGMALGYPEAWGLSANLDVHNLASAARAICSPLDAPDLRSDVVAAQLEVERTSREANSASYAYAPTLDAVSDFTYSNSVNLVRPVQWQVGAVLNIPLYDGGRTAAVRMASSAAAYEAQQRLTATSRTARLQMEQSSRAVLVARKNFEVSMKARDIARESARLARLAFVHGTGTSFDLVESARRQRLAEIDVTIKEFEVVRADLTAFLTMSNCGF